MGEKREPIWQAVLPFLTCGIWAYVWMYLSTDELKRHMGRADLNPGLEIFLAIVTCGIYYWYAMYRNTEMLYQANGRAGIQTEDRRALYVILMVFFYPATFYLFQEELNRLWDRTAGQAAAYR